MLRVVLLITGTDFIIFFTFLTHPKHLLKRLNAFFYLKSLVSDYLLKTTFFGNLSIKESLFLTMQTDKNECFLTMQTVKNQRFLTMSFGINEFSSFLLHILTNFQVFSCSCRKSDKKSLVWLLKK